MLEWRLDSAKYIETMLESNEPKNIYQICNSNDRRLFKRTKIKYRNHVRLTLELKIISKSFAMVGFEWSETRQARTAKVVIKTVVNSNMRRYFMVTVPSISLSFLRRYRIFSHNF